jgi:large subunit ribosomal protein L17
MVRNQLTALFEHERIVTTLAKAKNLRPVAERMVTMARTGSLSARRRILTMVPDREIVRRLFDDIAPRFMDRPGGYTRILRLGRRHGDGAELAIIEFVDYELKEKGDASSDKGKPSLMDRAKSMFGGGAKDEAEAAPAEEHLDELEEDETIEIDDEELAAEAEAAAEEPETDEDEDKK